MAEKVEGVMVEFIRDEGAPGDPSEGCTIPVASPPARQLFLFLCARGLIVRFREMRMERGGPEEVREISSD